MHTINDKSLAWVKFIYSQHQQMLGKIKFWMNEVWQNSIRRICQIRETLAMPNFHRLRYYPTYIKIINYTQI